MYSDSAPAPMYTYETDPEILKAQIDLLSNPYTSAYADQAYIKLQTVQQQCQADYVASCTNSGDFMFALNDFFNSDPYFLINRRKLAEARNMRPPSFFHDKVMDPVRHMYHALTGQPAPHMDGERPRPEDHVPREPRDREQGPNDRMREQGPNDRMRAGRPQQGGRPGQDMMMMRPGPGGPKGHSTLMTSPQIQQQGGAGAPRPAFTLRGGMMGAAPHHGAVRGPGGPAPGEFSGPGARGAGEGHGHGNWGEHNHDGADSSSTTETVEAVAPAVPVAAIAVAPAAPAVATSTIAAVPAVAQRTRKLWFHNHEDESSSNEGGDRKEHHHGWHNHDNGADSSSSTDVGVISSPPVDGMKPAPFGFFMPPPPPPSDPMPEYTDAFMPPPPPPRDNAAGDSSSNSFGWFSGESSSNSEASDSSSSSSSSSSSNGRGWHDHHHHMGGPDSNYIPYQGTLGFGQDGDSCVYANLDTFSQPCQQAVQDVYALRIEYEDQGHKSHCAGAFWWLVIIGAILFFVGRKHRARRQKVVALLKALEANPALKTQVEAETGLAVPPPPCCGDSPCKRACPKIFRALAMFVVVIFLGFCLVITSLVISGNLVLMMTSVNDDGSLNYPSPGAILMVVALVIFTNLLLMMSLASLSAAVVQKIRARRANRRAVAESTAPSSGSAPSKTPTVTVCPHVVTPGRVVTASSSRQCFFARVAEMMPSFPAFRPVSPTADNSRGLYSPLNTAEEGNEMVSIEYGSPRGAPQYQLPPVQMQTMMATSYGPPQPQQMMYVAPAITSSSAPGPAIYVPVSLSAESQNHINML